ncbi:peptidoglycan-binding protein [Streptomyces sp. NBC_00009]|uniref:peptidoglycan-binding protein n=1 Tax=Streptomyces sp. NBC_00009 TaxID=2975620 RepID=UPI0032509BB6
MPDIEIDTSQLTFPGFAVPEAGTGVLDGSVSPPPTVSLPVGDSYHLEQGTQPLSDFVFAVKADGTVDFDPSLDAFLSGRGERRLTVRGLPVTLDATALDHPLKLQPTGMVLAPDRPHQLSLLPSPQYRVDGQSMVGHFTFDLTPDGGIGLDPVAAGFVTATGHTLTVRGFDITIDGTGLAHDLLFAPSGAELSRGEEHQLTVIPGTNFAFQAGSAVARWTFGVGPAGEILLDPGLESFATANGGRLTIHGYEITIDGTALSGDLLAAQQNVVLSHAEVHRLRMMPAQWYFFQLGTAVASWQYEVGLDGKVGLLQGHSVLDPEQNGFATARDSTLTIHGYEITIDGTALSGDLLAAQQNVVLSHAEVHRLRMMPAQWYFFQLGTAVASWQYEVGLDGKVGLLQGHSVLDPEQNGFATARDSTLTIHGYEITIDGTALSGDLRAIPMNILLPRTRTNPLTLIPSPNYSFQAGTAVAHWQYGVGLDGGVDFPEDCDGFLAGRGTRTLVVRGCPLVVDATQADSDLVDIVTIGAPAQTARELFALVIPAENYIPRTANGTLRTPFNVEKDGTPSFRTDPATHGFYAVAASSAPTSSQPGQEVTFRFSVRAESPGQGTPQGNVTFTQEGELLGSVPLDPGGRATLRTVALPAGEHEIAVNYLGNESFEPSSVSVRHRVEPAGEKGDALSTARNLLALSERLAGDGQLAAAVAPAQSAVDVLHAFDPPPGRRAEYLNLLASALHNMVRRLLNAKRDDEVAPFAEEAVAIYEEAAKVSPATSALNVADGLITLSGDVSGIGLAANAVTAAQAGVAVLHGLEPEDNDLAHYVLSLALAAFTWALRLIQAGRGDEAVQPALEAVQVYQGLADVDPSRFEPPVLQKFEQQAAAVTRNQAGPGEEPVPDPALSDTDAWDKLPPLKLMDDPHAVDGFVKLAQALLNTSDAGPRLTIDGNFGPLTETAVRDFQTSQHLPATAVIDSDTWFTLAFARPFPVLEPGPRTPPMAGPPVATLQRLLNLAGAVPQLDVDARFGPATDSGLRAFQTRHGIAPTGKTTAETWAALSALPAQDVPSETMRLTFSYDSEDWAANGPAVRLVSREDIAMTAPLCDDLETPTTGLAGFWYEVQDAQEQALYRRGRHMPITLAAEVPSDKQDGSPGSFPVDSPKGTFELLVPILARAQRLVLFSSPLDPERQGEPAAPVASFTLSQLSGGPL